MFDALIFYSSCCQKKITLGKRSRGRPVVTRPKQEETSIKTRSSTSSSKKARRVPLCCVTIKRARNVWHDVEFVLEIGPSDTEYPSFKLDLKEYQAHDVVVPRYFAKEAGLNGRTTMVIKDPRGRVWVVRINLSQRQARLGAGWSNFMRDKLGVGDTFLFQFIAKSGSIRIQIVNRARDGNGGRRNKHANPC